MNKLIMCKGLPASGKSTYAKKLVADQQFKRINRDDLRAMIDNSKWSKGNESSILEVELLLAETYLAKGLNVVIDDCNLSPQNEKLWFEFANIQNAIFEVKDFTDIPVDECIRRDSERVVMVGKKVIMRMYNQFLKPKVPVIEYNPELPDCYIFDIDGTLAIKGNRSPYDWSKVGEDKVNNSVKRVYGRLRRNGKIFIFSGRDSVCGKQTKEWLELNEIDEWDGLYMRPYNDSRKDSIVKQELYESYIKDKYNVIAIFDDRNQVVEMWRSLGLTCFQVQEGDF